MRAQPWLGKKGPFFKKNSLILSNSAVQDHRFEATNADITTTDHLLISDSPKSYCSYKRLKLHKIYIV